MLTASEPSPRENSPNATPCTPETPSQVQEGSCAFPLSREAGEGDKGGEGKKACLPVHARAGKMPLPQRFRAEPMYPYQLAPSPACGRGGICRGDGPVAYTAARPYTPPPQRGRGAGGEG